eukprot:1714023-Amphidinium_carterae.1
MMTRRCVKHYVRLRFWIQNHVMFSFDEWHFGVDARRGIQKWWKHKAKARCDSIADSPPASSTV